VLVDIANYGRMQPLLEELNERPDFRLEIVCCGSLPLRRFGWQTQELLVDGLPVVSEIFHEVEGSTPETMTASCGLLMLRLAAEIWRRRPDMVLLIGDRYQALAAAIAARFCNSCLVHLQGGEQSGTIDESIRHAITQLAHYHGPATERAAQTLLRLGQPPETILAVGCPSSDLAAGIRAEGPIEHGRIVCAYHPQTTRYGDERREMTEMLGALLELALPTTMFWPNIDPGSDLSHKRIRMFRDSHRPEWLEMRRGASPKEYLRLVAGARLCIGNSSSFVRDASYFGTPVVLVGDRQQDRETAENVKRCRCVTFDIVDTARRQLAHGRYGPSDLYGDGLVCRRLADAMAGAVLFTEKRLPRPADLIEAGGPP